MHAGQFICGNKKCDEVKDLKSYEVNFAYAEAGAAKQARLSFCLTMLLRACHFALGLCMCE